ncbi:hypothetical protein FX982_03580 [Pseudomonas graminis]|jgi:hypothetical protein|uniref:Uncharacterized protein n=1 Tax=Pseudomonas graminis TaxID=158627 RepID=A0A6M8MS92_9PSED|nr:hypothetical protein FX982_03580 [Pseudomonas graminis]
MVPQARDGSVFVPSLGSRNGYTVGPKGDERKFAGYDDALAFLRSQPAAYWRRPNAQGNWGIVVGVRWIDWVEE